MTKNICRRILKKIKNVFQLCRKKFFFISYQLRTILVQKKTEKNIDFWSKMQSIFESEFSETSYELATLKQIWVIWIAFNRKWIRLVATFEKFEEVSALQIPTKCSKTAPIYQLLEWSNFDQFFSIRKNLNKMRTNRMYRNVTEMLQESVLSMLLSRVTVVKLNSKEASLDILCCIVLYLPNRIAGSPKSYFIYKGQNALGISHEFFIQFNFQLSFISFRFVSFHLHANIHMWRYIEL